MNQDLTHIHQHKAPEISVAPMMDWTDRHCRFFHRLISPRARLYTEMVSVGAILHGDKDRHLRFSNEEQPVALQLGGSVPQDLERCAQLGEEYGYNEINLNCGCPSGRVQNGGFGACLMREPALVASCVQTMQKAVKTPVSVKCRIGIDHEDSFEFLDRFVGEIADKGCTKFIIHARKAWLSGLSPKENRTKPKIDYERVAQIKEKYPQLMIIVNGEITKLEHVKTLLRTFDGVMIGREAYANPWFLNKIEQEIFKAQNLKDRQAVARAMILYAQKQNELYGTPVKSITRHILGLYHHQKGAKSWRRTLSTQAFLEGAGPEVIEQALEALEALAA